MQVHVNAREFDADYLRSLNTCFPGWGGQEYFAWVFARALHDAPMPDRMVLTEDGQVLAGSGVSYRRLVLPTGEEVLAGIMTGSWTLPAARGRGCFARIIEESRRLTAERGGLLLLAFVTADNASCRQLLKAGAIAAPSVYAIRPASTSNMQSGLRPVDLAAEHFQRWSMLRRGSLHFAYTSEDFQSQFLNVPGGTVSLMDEDGSFVVIREKSDTNQILAFAPNGNASRLLEQVAAYSAGKKLYVFLMGETNERTLQELGFQIHRGFLTMDIACRRVPPEVAAMFTEGAGWALQAGDKM